MNDAGCLWVHQNVRDACTPCSSFLGMWILLCLQCSSRWLAGIHVVTDSKIDAQQSCDSIKGPAEQTAFKFNLSIMSSSELKPIILYDIPCITPGRPWSPNTMKARYVCNLLPVIVAIQPQHLTDHHHFVRYCLGYKRLPFTTAWVELQIGRAHV